MSDFDKASFSRFPRPSRNMAGSVGPFDPPSMISLYLPVRRRSIFTRLAVGFSAALLVVASPAVHAATLPDGTIPNGFGVQLKTTDPETLNGVQALGLKWVRRGFYWNGMEKEKGVYDFTGTDKMMADFKAHGFSAICVFFGNNALYGAAGGGVITEEGRAGYAKWAAACALRYKDSDVVWEIWNEPNTMTFWGKHGPNKGNTEPYADEYTKLVEATVPAIKKASPTSLVAAGSVSNMWTESYKWMDFCFAKGMLKIPFDAWSVHPYGVKAPEDYIEAYGHMRKQMADAGADPTKIAVMNTERGFPIGKAEGYAGGDASKAFEYQAWHIVRQYLIDQYLGLKVTSWYEWSGKEGFALVPQGGGTPSPAYNACKVMIAQLSGYKLDKRLEPSNGRDFVMRYVNGKGGVKLVCWAAPALMSSPDTIVNHALQVPVGAAVPGPVPVADLFGVASTLPVQTGNIEVKLTGAPQYVTLHP